MKMNLRALAVLFAGAAAILFAGCNFLDQDQEMLLGIVEPPPEESDMTVPQLIARMHEATDPKNVWRDCKSYILRQSVREEEKKGKSIVEHYYRTEIKFRQPRQLRQTSYRDDAAFQTLLFRDDKGWSIDSRGVAEEIQKGTGLNLFRNYIGFSDPKTTEAMLFPTIELAVVYLDEKRTYRMICRSSDPKIAPYVQYIDAKTFLPVKAETVLYTNDGAQYLYRSEPMDYRWVSNVKIPLRTKVTVGEKIEEFTTDEFIIDPPVTNSDFEIPQSAQIDYTRTK